MLLSGQPAVKPIYLVSGWMRSGTSMMLEDLEKGGMLVDHSPGNKDWELEHTQWQLDSNPAIHEGHALKCICTLLPTIAPWPGRYLIVFMNRDIREQRESWERRSGARLATYYIEKQINKAKALAYNRKDMAVMELEYEKVLENPIGALYDISQFWQLGINISKAATVMDIRKRHHHASDEELEWDEDNTPSPLLAPPLPIAQRELNAVH